MAGAYTIGTNETSGGAQRRRSAALREHEREVQKQRGQQQDRNRVAPVEDPVQTVEAPTEREREEAEGGDREPEEVQRRRVARAPHTDGAPDEERGNTDRRQQEIKQARTTRYWGDLKIDDFAGTESENGVPKRRALRRTMEGAFNVGGLLHRPIVDRQQAGHLEASPSTAAGVSAAISAATTPCGLCAHRTPSSTSLNVARETMLATPRHSSAATTTTGKTGERQRTVAPERDLADGFTDSQS